MRTVPRERFRAALAALDRERFAGFVAAVYRARGRDAAAVDDRTVRIDGRRVHVHAPGLTGWASVPDDVDAVATPGAGRPRGVPRGVTVIDGDALYERTVHGVDAAARARLFARLDCDPVTGSGSDPEPQGRARNRRLGHALVGVLALALVLAGAVGGVVVDTVGDAPAERGAADPSVQGTATPFAPAGAPGTATPKPTPIPPDDYPDWIESDGRVLGGALAEAHARAVTGESYRLVLSASEDHDGRTVGRFRQVLAVQSPTVYRSVASARGRPVQAGVPWFGITYADGTRHHVLVNRSNRSYRSARFATGGNFVDSGDPPRAGILVRYDNVDPVAAFAGAYISEVFSGTAPRLVGSTVSEGTRVFRIRTKTTDPRIGNITTVALVEPDGFVRQLERQYVPLEADAEVSVTLRYDTGTVTITPPEWYRNGTRIGAS